MKHRYNHLLYSCLLALAASIGWCACSSSLEKVTLQPSAIQPAKLQAQSLQTTLTPKAEKEVALRLEWTPTTLNYPAALKTTVQMDTVGSNWSQPIPLGAFTNADTQTTLTVAQLNSHLLKLLGKRPLAPVKVAFRLASQISSAAPDILSNEVHLTFTPYSAERSYPQVWVIGDYCGWDHAQAQHLFSFNENETYQGIVDFGEKAANGFKITGVADWNAPDKNWGLPEKTTPTPEATSIQLIADGNSGNIGAYTKRFYHFTFNTSSLLLQQNFAFNTLGIIGDGAISWEEDVPMNFDAKKQRFWADVTLKKGEIKFRADQAWNKSWGGADGQLNSDANIPVTPGNYRVYVNLNKQDGFTYEISADDYQAP